MRIWGEWHGIREGWIIHLQPKANRKLVWSLGKKPRPAKTFLLLLDDLNAGGRKQPQRGGTDECHVLIALITNSMLLNIPTWKVARLCQNQPSLPVRGGLTRSKNRAQRSPTGLSRVPGDVFNTTRPRYALRPDRFIQRGCDTHAEQNCAKSRSSQQKRVPQWGFLISGPCSTTCNYQDCLAAPHLGCCHYWVA